MRCVAKSFSGILFLVLMLSACASSVEEQEKFLESDFSGLETLGQIVPISEGGSASFASFLNYADLVATNAENYSNNVRVYHFLKSDHCRNPVECRDNERLYIAVRQDDERPGLHALYLSPKAFSWKFLRWIPEPKNSGCEEAACAVLEVEAQQILLKNGKIIERGKFEIGVSAAPLEAYIKQIK